MDRYTIIDMLFHHIIQSTFYWTLIKHVENWPIDVR